MTNKPNNQANQKPEKKRLSHILLVLIALMLYTVILFFVVFKMYDYFLGDRCAEDDQKIHLNYDENSTDGDLSGKSKDEIIAALNEKVQDGMINISMNTNPVFETGTAKGTLMITNSEINRYPQQVEIYLKDTNELIYSGGVEVGRSIETSTLSVNLPKGEYECIAYFHAVNPETGKRVGTAGANIKITILL